jgi:hypothetical protein
MKIAITGHTSGIGKGMYDHFLNQNHEVFGLSRSNGFDISKNTKEIVEISEECDLFINNAYSGDSQLKLLMLLKDKVNNIVVCEFSKSYLTKEVEVENKEGYFLIYKRVINRIVEMVQEVNPEYPTPRSLISTVVEGSLHQHFLKNHFKTITDCNEKTTPKDFFTAVVLKQIS